MALEKQVIDWDRLKYVVEINQLMGSQRPSDYWIANDNTDLCKKKKKKKKKHKQTPKTQKKP